jgi:hypothetical protein
MRKSLILPLAKLYPDETGIEIPSRRVFVGDLTGARTAFDMREAADITT